MPEAKTKNTIQFILDNKIVTVQFGDKYNPTTTLLNYLRSLPNHKGVKEGCAEGDCGACTVVIADIIDGKIVYKAVNSCLVFLPAIHGKQVITVENLAESNGKELRLHPVQKALVESDGTQCGFCTPGVVMSLFGLYKSPVNPTRIEVEKSLAGNLCRCTGYQPIMNAAINLPENNNDIFSENEPQVLKMIEKIKNTYGSLELSNGEQQYFKPLTLTDALKLKEIYPDAVVISGATDIALRQTKKFEKIDKIIDISGIESLKTIKEDNGFYIIGAGSTLEEMRLFFRDKIPALSGMLDIFASKQIRNVATIGGNLATASPISDTIPLMFAIEAWITISGKKGERTCNMDNFIKGYRKTALSDEDIIKEVIIPKPKAEKYIEFYKVSKRKDVDISSVSAGFSTEIVNGVINSAILAYGGMAAYTKRAQKAENFLIGKEWNREIIEEAAVLVQEDFSPISDVRAGADYRNEVAKNLLIKYYFEKNLPDKQETISKNKE